MVTVIILLGVLSITALGRFVRPSAFAPAVLSGAVVGELRQARQLATSRSDARAAFELYRDGGDWRLVLATDVDGTVRDQRVGASDTMLTATSGAASVTLDAATVLRLEFHGDGDLAAVSLGGVPGDPGSGVELALGGDSNRTLCIYPSGYATDSACL